MKEQEEDEDSEDDEDEGSEDEDGDLDEMVLDEDVTWMRIVTRTEKAAPNELVMQMKRIRLTTPISWSDFEFALANALGVAPKTVRVAYRFSTAPQASSFHHVQNASELAELVKDAEVAEDGLAKSRAQTKKKFVVHLKCTGEQSEKDKKAKGKGKAKTGKNKRKRAKQSDSDSSSDEDGEGKTKKHKMGQAQWIAQITADNQCLEHKRICLKSIASHPPLKNTDIATWALIMVNTLCTIHIHSDIHIYGRPLDGHRQPILLPKLKLDFEKAVVTPVPPHTLVPAPPPTYQTAMGGYGPYGAYTLPPASPFRSQGYSRCNEMPSSDPIEPTEDVTLFPRLEQWLTDLDNGMQGHDGHNFALFAPDFLREKYMRISDLDGLTMSDVLEMCSGMARGTAKKIIDIATRECKDIRKKEKQRVREMETMPRHYH
ncbi:hypothetical protein BT96DRAFT_990323 [Gymnopus androsaceus JB14]|uniref:Uncharacterized protein n=1 Tax=Gymnopus androsaceus JB14 TaxID=1447944 RepID=A0A6A4HZJ2_9AGAR|nr:hypothetical protein BT96DRAFT_990323 [Gymnopus androsaceus JB14]